MKIDILYNKVLPVALMLSAVMAVSCGGKDEIDPTPVPVPENSVVGFATGLGTRVTTGAINTTDDLKASSDGFGVFAYLTDDKTLAGKFDSDNNGTYVYDDFTDYFMYNQQVTWRWADTEMTTKDWMYDPVKYWPNSTDNATARYISFFAYAPHSAAGAEYGVVNFTRSVDRSPHVIYKIGDGTQQTDLLYANAIDQTRNGQGLITDATPTYQKVNLQFHHALAALDIFVQRVYDEPAYTGKTPASEANTKLFVSKLDLFSAGVASTVNPLQKGGRLDLRTGEWSSGTAESGTAWSSSATAADNDVTITYSETMFQDIIRGTAVEGTTDAQKLLIADSELDKWGKDTENHIFGVNEQERYLIKDDMPQMFLPGKVTLIPTLTYSMVTRDDDLTNNYLEDTDGHRYSRILNIVTGNSITLDLVAGKRYTVLLRIYAEHIDFLLVSVTDWDFPMRFDPSVVSGFTEETIGHKLDEE